MQQQLNLALKEVARLKSQLELQKEKSPSIDSGQSANPITTPNNKQSTNIQKATSINSYWWPSPTSGLLGKLYSAQNPSDCSADSTKFFVWRSRIGYEKDTRGLTAWGHACKSHLMHGEFCCAVGSSMKYHVVSIIYL